MNGYGTLVVGQNQEPLPSATNRTLTPLRWKPSLPGERPANNNQNLSTASHPPVAFPVLALDILLRALNAADQFLTRVKHVIIYSIS